MFDPDYVRATRHQGARSARTMARSENLQNSRFDTLRRPGMTSCCSTPSGRRIWEFLLAGKCTTKPQPATNLQPWAQISSSTPLTNSEAMPRPRSAGPGCEVMIARRGTRRDNLQTPRHMNSSLVVAGRAAHGRIRLYSLHLGSMNPAMNQRRGGTGSPARRPKCSAQGRAGVQRCGATGRSTPPLAFGCFCGRALQRIAGITFTSFG